MIRLILTLLVIHAAGTAARLFPSTNDYAPLYTPAELKQNDLRRAQGLAPIKPFAAIAHGLQNFVPPVAMSDVKRMQRKRVGHNAAEENRVPQSPFFATTRKVTGVISVHRNTSSFEADDGEFLGYLNINRIVKDSHHARKYEFLYTSARDVTEIIVPNEDRKLAISVGLLGPTLGEDVKAFHLLRETHMHTTIDEPPTSNPFTGEYLQTTVFSIDSDTHIIGLHWMNPDASHPTLYPVTSNGMVYVSGDPRAFVELAGEEAERVVLRWVTQ